MPVTHYFFSRESHKQPRFKQKTGSQTLEARFQGVEVSGSIGGRCAENPRWLGEIMNLTTEPIFTEGRKAGKKSQAARLHRVTKPLPPRGHAGRAMGGRYMVRQNFRFMRSISPEFGKGKKMLSSFEEKLNPCFSRR